MANRILRSLAIVIGLASCLCAGKDTPATGQAANDNVELRASVITDRAAVKAEFGSDFEGGLVLVQITVTPKGKVPLAIRRDDFLLRSERDGKRTGPFAPNQLAGEGGMVLKEQAVVRQGPLGDLGGPIWAGTEDTKPKTGDKQAKPNPLLTALKTKGMPEKNTLEPVSGFLYFPLEKQRPKDLELDYSGPAGPLKIRFHQ